MKVLNKTELQQIALNHLSDISSAEPHSFLVHDATLASDNSLRFRKNIFNI